MLSKLQSYRHHRGGTYTLLYVAENSENRAELMAVYVSHLKQKVLVRPWALFTEEVEWPDGVRRPRFAAIADPEAELARVDAELAPEVMEEILRRANEPAPWVESLASECDRIAEEARGEYSQVHRWFARELRERAKGGAE